MKRGAKRNADKMKKLFKTIIVKIITWEARAILWQHKPYIIAVTGNLGKTTTKDAMITALSNLSVRGSDKSLNSDIGVPLTIINAKNPWNNPFKWLAVLGRGIVTFFAREYPEYLVLEVGADMPDDIRNIVRWLRPEIVVITQFAQVPVHIANFDNDRELLIQEKEYLALAATELLIYNGDDIDCQRIAKRLATVYPHVNKVSYGRGLHNTLIVRDAGNSYDLHQAVGTLEYNHRLYKVTLDETLGQAAILSVMPGILASIYVNSGRDGDAYEVINETINRLKTLKRQPGRMRPLYGMKNTLIIDDTYNSSPKALENGLETLREINGKYRKIVVLSDMKELGDRSAEEHRRVGRIIPSSANVLITYGLEAKNFALGAMDAGMNEGYILECDKQEDVIKELKHIIRPGDIIYVKGSQSMRMEKVVKAILDHKSHDSAEVLVRQEDEWLRK